MDQRLCRVHAHMWHTREGATHHAGVSQSPSIPFPPLKRLPTLFHSYVLFHSPVEGSSIGSEAEGAVLWSALASGVCWQRVRRLGVGEPSSPGSTPKGVSFEKQ